ncbi:protein-glutamate O-methyltransferase CheR [Halospina sp. K52047b]|jgi:chemotaxis protein methyltransferase CheR/type IV pilus assembly protein PilK|uniref:CheR family methyltransferase n=1 Tax=Halospina sp. K52047b TaxID=2614160 RepID=UPI003369D73D
MVNAENDNPSTMAMPGFAPGMAMDDAQFEQWRDLLESRTGMTLTPERRSFLEANVGTRLRELGFPSYQAYYEKVMYGPGAIAEWATLVDRLTVQETRFFRDADAFELVADYARERYREPNCRTLEAWSLGCATGEEAYTLAMILHKAASEAAGRRYFGVTGTDISLVALDKARHGVYGPRRLAGTAPYWQSHYFETLTDNSVSVIPELRKRVSFSQLNILELRHAPMHGMDIIFCQNVLIYFRRWRRRDIANRLADLLAPGGLLILGQGELTDWQHPELTPVAARKVLAWQRSDPQNGNRSDHGPAR